MLKKILEERLTKKAVYGFAKLITCAYPEAKFNRFTNSIDYKGKKYYIDDIENIIKILENLK